MNFQESTDYLYSLGNEVLAMKLGLENIATLLAALGDPQKNYLKIQIAGTNGKGSTVAFLESILVSAGIETGATTSPHLVSVTERVRINGEPISETNFARLATIVRETSERLVENSILGNSGKWPVVGDQIQNCQTRDEPRTTYNEQPTTTENRKLTTDHWPPTTDYRSLSLETVPTYFEQVTAIALLAFAEAKIELAILETGLGGRFDATTAARAEIVAITPIDLDHERILGETLAEIAGEKAAIIRADTRVFVAPQKKEAEQVIYGKCRETGVEPTFAHSKFHINEVLDELGIFPFPLDVTLEVNGTVFYNLRLKMQGRHQYENAALAALIAQNLKQIGFSITHKEIKQGLEEAVHRGRLEFHRGILFDGAHNAAGARALRKYLDEFIKQPITLVFGAMRDKNLKEIAAILFPKAQTLILTKPANPRAAETSELLGFVPENLNSDQVIVAETVAEALKIAPFYATKGIVCVTGSLYLVGEAQEILENAF